MFNHLALRLYCRIVSIEGTAKETYYTVRELVTSDLLIHILHTVGIGVLEGTHCTNRLPFCLAGPTATSLCFFAVALLIYKLITACAYM